ncbi:MAG: Uma2 family endonuclease [Armatimonadetes bacterium]|nr:Uma2 family endonuclease [Armatimonadota bacterium]
MAAMSIHVQPREQRLLTHTDWNGYLQCREALDETGVRITYDKGAMELMSPSPEHEQGKSDLGCCLEAYLQERGIDFSTGGSPTMRREAAEKGLEPDESYYLREHAGRRFASPPEGLNINPPDLVLEIEVTRSAIDRLTIFANLRIPEVWRYDYDTHRISIHVLGSGGHYARQESSGLLPDLPVQSLASFVRRGPDSITSRLLSEVRDWVRRGCPPIEPS